MKLSRFQFRLRTLLLIVIIVAVQCAVCFPALRDWQEQKRRRIEEKNVIFSFSIPGPAGGQR
ncbi:MAG TPA: hypothetical protein VGH32_03680 [Pirellulales bacterium]